MTTSGTDSYPVARDSISRRALRMVGAYSSMDAPKPDQLLDAITALNMMLKSWSAEGFLWLRQFVTIDIIPGTNSYQLGPASTVPMDRPCHIFGANFQNASGNEVIMEPISRSDWMAIPSKASKGTPVQFYYDSQQTNGIIYVWPTPSPGLTGKLVLDVDRQLDIMVDSLNTYDFPPSWYEAIVYGLAARLAPEYAVPITERKMLVDEASSALAKASTDDRDTSSVYFEVRK
jgi:hypothetical protein